MSDTQESGFISKVIGPKRRWRAYKARVKQLPEDYRTAVDAIEHYLMHFVPTDGDSAVSEFEDLDRPRLVRRHPHRRVHLRHGHVPPQDRLDAVVPEQVGSSGPPWRLSAANGSPAPRRPPDETARQRRTQLDWKAAVV